MLREWEDHVVKASSHVKVTIIRFGRDGKIGMIFV
jgi:hypothetical protein